MERKLLIVLLLVLFFYFNIPKDMLLIGEEEVVSCECMGFEFREGKGCIGLTFDCRVEQVDMAQAFKPSEIREICSRRTCETFEEYLGIKKEETEAKKRELEKLDVMVIMDTSYSMTGEKMQKTIDASISMIGSLKPQDRVGVISFNTHSKVIHDFTLDKQEVITSLGTVVPEAYTSYVDALLLAKDQFEMFHDQVSKDVIIFISDGLPQENESEILEVVEDLDRMGISIYTLRIGNISLEEEDELDILEKMTNVDEQQGFYTFTEIDSIYNSFDSILQSLSKEEDLFIINANVKGDLVFPEDTSIPVIVQLFSSENMRVVPGFTVQEDEVLCVDDARVDIVVRDLESRMIENMTMTYVRGQYIAELSGIPAGMYGLEAYVEVLFENASDCSFMDVQSLGTVNITSLVNGSCVPLGCAESEELLRDTSIDGGNSHLFDSGRKILFAIDSSASMKDEGKMLYAKNSLKRMVDKLGMGFSVGLISFGTQASLAQPFTMDTEAVKETVDSLGVSGTTNFIPVLEKAKGLLGSKGFDPEREISSDIFILISDGIPWDKGSPESIMGPASQLVEQGVCIFTIGYGTGEDRIEILEDVALLSQSRLGCGGYFYSSPSETDLDRIFRNIYSDISNEGELFIRPRINSQVFAPDDSLTMTAGVFSSYNTMSLPIEDAKYCRMDARVLVKEMDPKNRTIVELPMEYSSAVGYHLLGRQVDIEATSIRIEASFYDRNGTACQMTGVKNIPIRSVESRAGGKGYRFYLQLSAIIVNLFLLMVMAYSLIFILKGKEDS